MTAKDVLKRVVEFSYMVTRMYVEDLSDADLLVRCVPKGNHIAWQLGHLIAGQADMLEKLGYRPPPLPPNFVEMHTKETAASDDPKKFLKKPAYLELMEKTKAATLAAIEATPERDFEKPAPEPMRSYAPQLADALAILGTHWLMHAGQFVPIRRKLGKPPLF